MVNYFCSMFVYTLSSLIIIMAIVSLIFSTETTATPMIMNHPQQQQPPTSVPSSKNNIEKEDQEEQEDNKKAQIMLDEDTAKAVRSAHMEEEVETAEIEQSFIRLLSISGMGNISSNPWEATEKNTALFQGQIKPPGVYQLRVFSCSPFLRQKEANKIDTTKPDSSIPLIAEDDCIARAAEIFATRPHLSLIAEPPHTPPPFALLHALKNNNNKQKRGVEKPPKNEQQQRQKQKKEEKKQREEIFSADAWRQWLSTFSHLIPDSDSVGDKLDAELFAAETSANGEFKLYLRTPPKTKTNNAGNGASTLVSGLLDQLIVEVQQPLSEGRKRTVYRRVHERPGIWRRYTMIVGPPQSRTFVGRVHGVHGHLSHKLPQAWAGKAPYLNVRVWVERPVHFPVPSALIQFDDELFWFVLDDLCKVLAEAVNVEKDGKRRLGLEKLLWGLQQGIVEELRVQFGRDGYPLTLTGLPAPNIVHQEGLEWFVLNELNAVQNEFVPGTAAFHWAMDSEHFFDTGEHRTGREQMLKTRQKFELEKKNILKSIAAQFTADRQFVRESCQRYGLLAPGECPDSDENAIELLPSSSNEDKGRDIRLWFPSQTARNRFARKFTKEHNPVPKEEAPAFSATRKNKWFIMKLKEFLSAPWNNQTPSKVPKAVFPPWYKPPLEEEEEAEECPEDKKKCDDNKVEKASSPSSPSQDHRRTVQNLVPDAENDDRQYVYPISYPFFSDWSGGRGRDPGDDIHHGDSPYEYQFDGRPQRQQLVEFHVDSTAAEPLSDAGFAFKQRVLEGDPRLLFDVSENNAPLDQKAFLPTSPGNVPAIVREAMDRQALRTTYTINKPMEALLSTVRWLCKWSDGLRRFDGSATVGPLLMTTLNCPRLYVAIKQCTIPEAESEVRKRVREWYKAVERVDTTETKNGDASAEKGSQQTGDFNARDENKKNCNKVGKDGCKRSLLDHIIPRWPWNDNENGSLQPEKPTENETHGKKLCQQTQSSTQQCLDEALLKAGLQELDHLLEHMEHSLEHTFDNVFEGGKQVGEDIVHRFHQLPKVVQMALEKNALYVAFFMVIRSPAMAIADLKTLGVTLLIIMAGIWICKRRFAV